MPVAAVYRKERWNGRGCRVVNLIHFVACYYVIVAPTTAITVTTRSSGDSGTYSTSLALGSGYALF